MQLVLEKKEFRKVLRNRQIFLFFWHFSCALIKPGTRTALSFRLSGCFPLQCKAGCWNKHFQILFDTILAPPTIINKMERSLLKRHKNISVSSRLQNYSFLPLVWTSMKSALTPPAKKIQFIALESFLHSINFDGSS